MVAANQIERDQSKPPGKYACQDCNEMFTAIDQLVTHRAVVHPQIQLTDDEVFGRFERAHPGAPGESE